MLTLASLLVTLPLAGDPLPGSGGARWGADYFPDVPLVTHEGRTVRFFDDLIRGKVVLINFIYTSCPDACPLETARLVEVQDLLGERAGRDVFMYSISIDPERDTPERLREYSERFQTGPGWLFLTGAPADIRLLREKVGMVAADEESLQDHSLSLLLGNQATGQWMKRSPFENPYFLVTQLEGSLLQWKDGPARGPSYAEAPALRALSRGESLFRTRCAACHALGAQDGLARTGPDLLGVTARRDPTWLARWIAEPDALLAEQDPLALELRAAYRGLPMPNMRLSAAEVAALVEFLDQESARLAAAPAADVAGAEHELAPCCQKREHLVLEAAPAAEPADGWPAFDPSAPAAPEPLAVPAAGLPRSSLTLCAGLGLALGALALLLGRR